MPKWKNKGHEFDEIGNYLKDKTILFLGCDEEFKEKSKFINFKIRTLSNLPEVKTNNLFDLFKSIKRVRDFANKLEVSSNEIIIVSGQQKRLYKLLARYTKFKKDIELYFENTFYKKYMATYCLYGFNKLYNPFSTCIVLTTLCSLNCKYCLNYQPYIKNKCHYDYDKLIKDIDVFFNTFDRVEYFSLTGGEPLLYKQLPELLRYIANNYRDKVRHLWFATNGSVIPSDEICQAVKETGTEIVLDNYSKFTPQLKESLEKTIQKCKEFGLQYTENCIPAFFKTFPPSKDYTKLSEKALIKKFNKCKNLYSGFGLKDGKLCACCYMQFADTADLVKASENDYFNLLNNPDRKTLLEFVSGYMETGSGEFCKYCNCFFAKYGGGYDENGVTQQAKDKLLSWDINNPTKEPVEIQK